LLVVDGVPGIQDARGQVRIGQQLDLDLMQPALVVARLDIDDAETQSILGSMAWRMGEV